jgi:hypothetical protein
VWLVAKIATNPPIERNEWVGKGGESESDVGQQAQRNWETLFQLISSITHLNGTERLYSTVTRLFSCALMEISALISVSPQKSTISTK